MWQRVPLITLVKNHQTFEEAQFFISILSALGWFTTDSPYNLERQTQESKRPCFTVGPPSKVFFGGPNIFFVSRGPIFFESQDSCYPAPKTKTIFLGVF